MNTSRTIQNLAIVAHIIRVSKTGYLVIGWSDDIPGWQKLSEVVEFEEACGIVEKCRAEDEALRKRWENGDKDIVPRSFWNPNITYCRKDINGLLGSAS